MGRSDTLGSTKKIFHSKTSTKMNYKQQLAEEKVQNEKLIAKMELLTDRYRRGEGGKGLKLEKPMIKKVLTIVQHYSFHRLPFLDADLFYGQSKAMELVTEKLHFSAEKSVSYSASLCQTFLDKTNYLRAQALGRVKVAYLRTYHCP